MNGIWGWNAAHDTDAWSPTVVPARFPTLSMLHLAKRLPKNRRLIYLSEVNPRTSRVQSPQAVPWQIPVEYNRQ